VPLELGSREQAFVDAEQVLDGDLVDPRERVDRPPHGLDVVQDLGRRDVERVLAQGRAGLRLEQSTAAYLQALDPRGCHRLGTKQQTGDCLRVGQVACLAVETIDGPLGVDDVRGRRSAQGDRAARQTVGHIGLVIAAAPIASRQAGCRAR
jgi:hypothetical protein